MATDFWDQNGTDFWGGATKQAQINMSTIAAIRAGRPTWYGVIGTSIESGTSGVSWCNFLLSKVPNLMGAPSPPQYNQAVGSSTYADGGVSGIAGTQLDNILAAFARVNGPKLLDVGFGFNDMTGSGVGDPTSFVPYWNTILSRCNEAGVAVRFIGPLPGSTKSPTQVVTLDRLLALWCQKKGVQYLHIASTTILPTTGLPNSSLTDGTVHPNHDGAKLIAEEARKNLMGEQPTVSPWVQYCRPDYNSGTNHGLSLIDNGISTNASTGSADSTGWTDTTTGGTVTTAAAPGNFKGFGRVLTRTTSGTLETRRDSINYSFGSNVDLGDVLVYGLWKTASGMEANDVLYTVRKQPKFLAASGLDFGLDVTAAPITHCVYVDDNTATGMRFQLQLQGSASGPIATFGGLALVNTTKLATWGGI